MKIAQIKTRLHLILIFIIFLSSCNHSQKKIINRNKQTLYEKNKYFNGLDTIRLLENFEEKNLIIIAINKSHHEIHLPAYAMCGDPNLILNKPSDELTKSLSNLTFSFEIPCRDFFEDYIFDYDFHTKKYKLVSIIQKINTDEKNIAETQKENDTVLLIKEFTINETLEKISKFKLSDSLLSIYQTKQTFYLRRDKNIIKSLLK